MFLASLHTKVSGRFPAGSGRFPEGSGRFPRFPVDGRWNISQANENRENLNRQNCGIIRVFEGTLVGLGVGATGFSLRRARQACKSFRFATVGGSGAEF